MELTRDTFEELARVIHRLTGLVVGKEKGYLVRHRLGPLMKEFGCASFEALLRELTSPGSVHIQNALVEAITTKETSFFRDHWFFDTLRDETLPALAARGASGGRRHRVRIWSAAASTGQEAYSLAMLTRELAGEASSGPPATRFTILASDISTSALEVARSGRYTSAQVKRGVSESRLRRHFQRAGEGWQIEEELRQLVLFRRLDLLQLPADLSTFDLILCRNVLIYFDQRTREQVCHSFFGLLEPGGILGLGSAESLYGISDRFEMVKSGRTVLYRKPH